MELKTLKDLTSWTCECNCVTFDDGVCRSCGKSNPKYGEVDYDDLKQEAIKLVKYLLKLSKTEIIKMPKIEFREEVIGIEFGEFDGQSCGADKDFTREVYSALVLCKIYDLTEEDLK